MSATVLSTFEMGNKVLQVRDDGVYIYSSLKPEKNILLSYNSWAWLRNLLREIDVEVRELNRKTRPVKYRGHIGHGIYVSVTDGFKLVDFRLYYQPYGLDEGNERPTKRGISLRLEEWGCLIDLIPIIDAGNTTLAQTTACYDNNDHLGQLGYLCCEGCNPFGHMSWH